MKKFYKSIHTTDFLYYNSRSNINLYGYEVFRKTNMADLLTYKKYKIAMLFIQIMKYK